MIVPHWLRDEEAENAYKQILADNITHFHPGCEGRSCVFIDQEKEDVAGIIHVNGYQAHYKTADLTGLFFDKRMCTRENLIYILEWIFVELDITRCNMATQEHNRQARRFNEMLGAKLDAVLPMYWGDEPMYLYSLLKPDVMEYLKRLKKNVRKKEDDLV